MKYTISTKNVKNSVGINGKISESLEHLDKFFPSNKPCQAKIRLELRDRAVNPAKAEITISAGKSSFRAESSEENMFAALDECFDKLNRQVRKYKEKKIGSKRVENRVDIPEPEEDMDEIILNYEPIITRAKRFQLEPLSIEEAVKKMDSLGHDFFVFIDENTDEVAVVYNRTDNTYGIIHTY